MGRIVNAGLFDRPIVVTHSDFRFIAAKQLRQCDVEADIVLEPSRRNSATAVAVAAELAGKRRPQACILVLAADHVVRHADALEEACREAAKAAAAGLIVTFGITPTYSATSYGYIRPGAKLKTRRGARHRRLRRKAGCEKAGDYIAEHFLWNSGNFLFRADLMLNEIAHFEPDIATAAKSADAGIKNDLDFLRLPPNRSHGRRRNRSITP